MTIFIGLSDFDEINNPSRHSPPISAKDIHKEIINRTGKRHPRVLYVPTAKDDREDYIEFFKQYYLALGCSQVDVLRLLKSPPSKKEMLDKILSANAIYINGGNTHRMLATWKRLGVDEMLQQAHRRGTVMAGHSAGLVCWFKYACSNSFYTDRPFRLTGMGIIDAVVCPHYDGEPFRQPALKKIMKRTPELVGLALDDDTAIEIIDNSYRILVTVPTAQVRRTFWSDGRYVIEDIELTDEFRDLKQLLTKPR